MAEARATWARRSRTSKNIASPLQNVRDTFDLMPTATADDWAHDRQADGAVAKRSTATSSRCASQRLADTSAPGARSKTRRGSRTTTSATKASSLVFANKASVKSGELPASVRSDLTRAAGSASDAYARMTEFLRTELRSRRPAADAVGRERYALYSRRFLGSRVDLEETYEWGQQELARIVARMAADRRSESSPARRRRGDRVTSTTDPACQPRGHGRAADLDAGQVRRGRRGAWARRTSTSPNRSGGSSAGSRPPNDGGIYYTGPSEDLVTRPGRMWWSVPHGRDAILHVA